MFSTTRRRLSMCRRVSVETRSSDLSVLTIHQIGSPEPCFLDLASGLPINGSEGVRLLAEWRRSSDPTSFFGFEAKVQ